MMNKNDIDLSSPKIAATSAPSTSGQSDDDHGRDEFDDPVALFVDSVVAVLEV